MKSVLDGLEDSFRARASHEICRRIRESEAWGAAGVILFYAALPSEPDLTPLFLLALQQGKKCVFPKVAGEMLELYNVSAAGDLQKGAYGILEPRGSVRVPADSIGLALVPGLAFDRAGFRLGRGKGFYDRLLPDIKGRFAGCCFACQLQEALPVLEHDVRLDFVVTESGVMAPGTIL